MGLLNARKKGSRLYPFTESIVQTPQANETSSIIALLMNLDPSFSTLDPARLIKLKAAVAQKFVLTILRSFPLLSERKTSFKRIHLLLQTEGSKVSETLYVVTH